MPETIEQVGRFTTPPFPTGAGMDFDSPSFTLGTQKWRYAFNVRNAGRIVSIPQLFSVFGGAGPVRFIGSIAEGVHSIWLMVVGDKLYSFYPSSGSMVLNELATLPDGDRLSTCAFNDLIFFVSPTVRVFATDGRRKVSIFEGRKASLATTEDGQMFTKEERFDSFGNDVGRLPPIFDWTENEIYRVFCDLPNLFKQDWEVVLDFYNLTPSEPPRGQIIGVDKDNLIVRALNNVTGIENSPDVAGLIKVSSATAPTGRYIAVFFDHLFIGSGSKVMWSGLRDFAEWEPADTNEADSYTFTEHQSPNSLISGLTGMAVVGDELIVLTENTVYSLQYVGLPAKVQVRTVATGVGCTFYYGAIEANGALYWPDALRGGFFRFSPQGLERISFGIERFFFNDILLDARSVRETFAYHDSRNSEIVWTYPAYDGKSRAVVFDYKRNEWFVRQGSNLLSFAALMFCSKPIKDIPGPVNSLTGTFGDLGNIPLVTNWYWGDVYGNLLVNAPENADPAKLVPYEPALVETGNLLVSKLQTVKEFDAIALSASGPVKVYVGSAQNVDSAPTFKYVGTWNPTLSLGNLLPFEGGAVSGNALTFRFVMEKPNTNLSLIETNAFDAGAQF